MPRKRVLAVTLRIFSRLAFEVIPRALSVERKERGSVLMMILLLFLQKQNLAFAVYQFGSVLSLPD